jgi:hypothetical protein
MALALASTVGCASYGPQEAEFFAEAGDVSYKAPVMPPPGFIFSEIKAPLTYDYHETQATPPKVGRATSRYFCLFYRPLSIAWEKSSVADAARNGGIQEVEYADYEFFNVLGVYSEFTVVAYGR